MALIKTCQLIIVNSKKSIEEIKSNDYILIELEILNILLNAKYQKNNTKLSNYCCTVEHLMPYLSTESRKYVYRVIATLETKGFVENLEPYKREKHIKITNKGEDAVITIIKFLYPDKQQQDTALKMFYESQYTTK